MRQTIAFALLLQHSLPFCWIERPLGSSIVCQHLSNALVFSLDIFLRILLSNNTQDTLFTTFLQLAIHDQLVEHEIGFLEIEDEVEFTDIPKILVERLDVSMDDFERQELVVVRVDACDEEETGVAPVDDFRVLVFDKVAHFSAPREDEGRDVFHDLRLVFGGKCGEPFRESNLALPRHEQEVIDGHEAVKDDVITLSSASCGPIRTCCRASACDEGGYCMHMGDVESG